MTGRGLDGLGSKQVVAEYEMIKWLTECRINHQMREFYSPQRRGGYLNPTKD